MSAYLEPTVCVPSEAYLFLAMHKQSFKSARLCRTTYGPQSLTPKTAYAWGAPVMFPHPGLVCPCFNFGLPPEHFFCGSVILVEDPSTCSSLARNRINVAFIQYKQIILDLFKLVKSMICCIQLPTFIHFIPKSLHVLDVHWEYWLYSLYIYLIPCV